MAILCVQFAEHDTVLDSRGGVGFTLSPRDTIENKYRYEDYWNIIFQTSGHVLHPEASLPDRSPLANGIDVYPHPAHDELNFIVDQDGDITVYLCDLLGRKLRETTTTENGTRAHGRLNTSGLKPGLYLLVAQSRDLVRSRKVLVTK